MNNPKLNLMLSALLLCSLTAAQVHADDDDLQEIAVISKEFGLLTLDQAKAKATAAKPGLIKDAEIENRKFGKGWEYEFEIVDADGKEWDVAIDAKTGEVLKARREWF